MDAPHLAFSVRGVLVEDGCWVTGQYVSPTTVTGKASPHGVGFQSSDLGENWNIVISEKSVIESAFGDCGDCFDI